jgi:transposase-like protein
MGKQRRQHSEQFKFKVALEAAKGVRTINEIAGEYNVHPNQVSGWKKQLLEEGPGVFSRRREREQRVQAEQEAAL